MHLEQLIAADPTRKAEIQDHIRRQFPGAGGGGGSSATNATIASGPRTGEALAILLGGGKHNIDEGYKLLTAVQTKQRKEFAQRLRVVGLTEMADTIMQRLAQLSAVAA